MCGAVLGAALLCATGCANERSFPIDPQRVVRPYATRGSDPLTTQQWLVRTHAELAATLPAGEPAPLLSPQLRAHPGSIDVFRHFGIDGGALHTLLGNWRGLLETAQVTPRHAIDGDPEPWTDFSDVWIPVAPGVELSGRLGIATQHDTPRYADCVIVLPGILGDKGVLRTRDICTALRESGTHVLALDLRGVGQTLAKHPEVYSTFGVLEAGDLLAVDEWLCDKPFVRHCGIVGFCWGANQALLTAWEDGRDDDDPAVLPRIREKLRPRTLRTHFEAGIIAFSPVLRFEEILDQCARQHAAIIDPVFAGLQDRIREHMQRRGYPNPNGDFHDLLREEVSRSAFGTAEVYEDGLEYLRLMPYKGRQVSAKLDRARVPLLIVHAANDPLSNAQDIADFFTRSANPRVAGVILPRGGHDGFVVYARDYFYSLVLGFFDREGGAAACARRGVVALNAGDKDTPSNAGSR